MSFRRKYLAALVALVFVGLGFASSHVYSAATIDRAVCSTADAAGGPSTACSASELIDSATQEIAKLYQGNILVVQSVSGTNTITGSTSPVATSLNDGEMRQIKPAATNTGAVTYNDNGLGAKQLVSAAGGALSSGDLQSSTVYILRYYSANDEWRVLTNLGTGTASASNAYVTIGNTGALSNERALTEGTNGIDFVDGGANSSVTANFDATEVGTVTWGAGGSSYFWTFNTTGTSDSALAFFNGGIAIYNSDNSAPSFQIEDQGSVNFKEAEANGQNFLAFKAPSAVTSDATCTLENDSNFIPDSCVGNGTDDGILSTAIDTSAEIAAIVGNETGTAGALVFSNSPTLVTPVLGAATATSINKVTITAPATSATLTIPDGVTLTGPASSGTAMTLGNTETVTGEKTFGAAGNVGKLKVAGTTSGTITLDAAAVAGSNTLTLPAATDTLVGKATTDTLTNKSISLGSNTVTSTSAQLATAVSDETGAPGALVFSNSPSLTTPDLGTPSAATLTNAIGLPISTGVSGLGTGVSTALATPSSSNLAAAITDETGTNKIVFSDSPTLVTPALGTPSTLTLTNATGLPISGITGLGTGVGTALAVNKNANGGIPLQSGTPTSGNCVRWAVGGGIEDSGGTCGGGGGGGSPGGSSGQIQYNNAGSLGGFTASGDATINTGTGAVTIANDAVTYGKIQNVGANSVLARAASSSGDVSEVSLSASQLIGRGSSGDVAAISLGGGLYASGTTLMPGREVLTGNRTYYVRTDGSDSNNGLANTSGGAFLTIQKALDTVASLDRSTYTATVQVGSGTYTGAVTWNGGLGSVDPVLQGDTTTPSNVLVSVTSNDAIKVKAPLSLQGFKLATTTSGNCLASANAGRVTIDKIEFGACATAAMLSQTGGYIGATGAITISGSTQAWARPQINGIVEFYNITVTLSGTPAWSTAGIDAKSGGVVSLFNTTFSGSATGKRYSAVTNSVIDSFSSGTSSTYFPGNSNGTTATGGVQG